MRAIITLTFLSFTLMFSNLLAQDVKLKVDVIPFDGGFEEVRLVISTNSDNDIPQNLYLSDKHNIYLPPGNTYFLTYHVRGFIDHTVQVDIPAELDRKKIVNYDLVLYPQMTGELSLEYSSPVGYVSFDQEFHAIVRFDYDIEVISKFKNELSSKITSSIN